MAHIPAHCVLMIFCFTEEIMLAFSALMLLVVGWQEGHLAGKKS